MRQPIQVLVHPARLTKDGWEYLLLLRTANRGGFWQGVTGGVEDSESILEAAGRELFEETGFVPLEISEVGYSYSFPMKDRWRHMYVEGTKGLTEHAFVARVDGEQAPAIDATEHNKWQWCTLDGALEMLAWPENVEALKRCDSFLRSNKID